MTDHSRLSEERLEILRLVAEQMITPDEASKLLEALDRSDTSFAAESARFVEEAIEFEQGAQATEPLSFRERGERARRARNVRIRITDVKEGNVKINLVLPFGLIDSGLKLAKRVAPDRLLDSREIKHAVEEGFVGHLLDIEDNGEHIEILIEPRDTSASFRVSF